MYLKTMNGGQDEYGEGLQVSISMLKKLNATLEAEKYNFLAPVLDRQPIGT